MEEINNGGTQYEPMDKSEACKRTAAVVGLTFLTLTGCTIGKNSTEQGRKQTSAGETSVAETTTETTTETSANLAQEMKWQFAFFWNLNCKRLQYDCRKKQTGKRSFSDILYSKRGWKY